MPAEWLTCYHANSTKSDELKLIWILGKIHSPCRSTAYVWIRVTLQAETFGNGESSRLASTSVSLCLVSLLKLFLPQLSHQQEYNFGKATPVQVTDWTGLNYGGKEKMGAGKEKGDKKEWAGGGFYHFWPSCVLSQGHTVPKHMKWEMQQLQRPSQHMNLSWLIWNIIHGWTQNFKKQSQNHKQVIKGK